MYNLHFSGSTNNFKAKLKPQSENSITTNSKLNQYMEKSRKFYKSPSQTLNKSQNNSGAKNVFKANVKKQIINHNNKSHLNNKKIFPIQHFKNIHLINKNNYSIKINPTQYQTKEIISKNNSLSNYFTKTNNNNNLNLRRNNTNINIFGKQNYTNYNTTNYNVRNNNKSNYYQSKTNLYNLKKNPLIKIKDYLATDDFIINRNVNRNASFYPFVATEESNKKINSNIINNMNLNINENRNSSKISNTFIKKNNASIKKVKISSTSFLNKKTNFISNNSKNKSRVQTYILGNPSSSSGGVIENLSTEKTSGCARLDFETRIINEINDLKKYNNNELINKIKLIFEEVVDYLVPKESQNIFLQLIKEVTKINNEYLDNIKNLKENIEQLKTKNNEFENKYKELMNKYNKKEKELMKLKKDAENFFQEKENKNNNGVKHKEKKQTSLDIKLKRDNNYFKQLNTKNLNDLDALYFFDKVKYNQNEEKEVPKLNLDEDYIEKCIQKEVIKKNVKNLTPFQKIALQFEMPDT